MKDSYELWCIMDCIEKKKKRKDDPWDFAKKDKKEEKKDSWSWLDDRGKKE